MLLLSEDIVIAVNLFKKRRYPKEVTFSLLLISLTELEPCLLAVVTGIALVYYDMEENNTNGEKDRLDLTIIERGMLRDEELIMDCLLLLALLIVLMDIQ